MNSTPATVDDLIEQSFTIHSLDNYGNVRLKVVMDYFDLDYTALQGIILAEHHTLKTFLATEGIDYAELRNALVPQPGRHEAAFVFDSTRADDGIGYGHSLAKKWIPAIKHHGPEKSVLKCGDILKLPYELTWRSLEAHLVGPQDFPRMSTEQYFVIYMTNLSSGQLGRINTELAATTKAYLGYVDCSTWNLLKFGMHLPQIGLRVRDCIITDTDDVGTPNLPGLPYEENGFRIVGVPDELYGTYLSYRIDNGVPAWADDDSALSLSVLGGELQPVASTEIVIDEARIEYLGDNHRASLNRAGLAGLNRKKLAEAIKQKFTNGLIYNLRFVEGTRKGVPDPELDAMMYSVQVEFPDNTGKVRRYMVGLKYTSDTHTSEVVTFF